MKGLSADARSALAAFRQRGALDDGSKADLRMRLDASIANGEDAAQDPVAPRIDVPRSAMRIGIALAAAAGVLLALRVLSGGVAGDRAQLGANDRGDQASFEARASSVNGGAVPRAPKPATRLGVDAPESVVGAHDDPPTSPLAPSSAPPVKPPRRIPARVAPVQTSSEPQANADTELDAEMALMRGARVALREGSPGRALAILADHRSRFGAGQLREDRDALGVRALCDAGRSAEARTAASRFSRTYPGSMHADRVRKICAAQ